MSEPQQLISAPVLDRETPAPSRPRHPLDVRRAELSAAALEGTPAELWTLSAPAARGVSELERRDPPAVIAVGGTILAEQSGSRAMVSGLVLAAARGRLVAGVGVGAGVLRGMTDRLLARQLVRSARLLILRSEAAAHRLALGGAPTPFRVGADLIWLHPRLPPVSARRDELLVVGTPQDTFVAQTLADALPVAVARGPRLALASWPGQRASATVSLATGLARRLPAGSVELLPAWPDVETAVETARHSAAVLALDVDAQAIAALGGTPSLVLSSDEECRALAEDLGQPAISPIGAERTLPPALAALRERPWDGADAVSSLRERAAASLQLLRLVLDTDHLSRPAELSAGSGLLLWPRPVAR